MKPPQSLEEKKLLLKHWKQELDALTKQYELLEAQRNFARARVHQLIRLVNEEEGKTYGS